MYRRNKTKKIVTAGLLLALGIVLPMIFHSSGISGAIFLPMHIPVLIGGFLLPPSLALLLGALTPLLNSLITGMPLWFPIAIIMAFELAVYGLIASLMYRKLKIPSLISLIIAMVLGRAMAGIVVFFLVGLFGAQMDPWFYVETATKTGIPGIIIQLIIIPSLIYGIDRYTTLNLD